jgi:hypothetical protein
LSIVDVGYVRVAYDRDVPALIRWTINGVVAIYAAIYARRAVAADKAKRTRMLRRGVEFSEIPESFWIDDSQCAAVLAMLAQNVDVCGDKFGRPSAIVAAGTPNRRKRGYAAIAAIQTAWIKLYTDFLKTSK